jgi:hypothetical protein
MQLIVKVQIGLPQALGKVPMIISNRAREERIARNEAKPDPDEVYWLLEASEKMVARMEGKPIGYFYAEIGDGEMHLLREATYEEYLAGAPNKSSFTIT